MNGRKEKGKGFCLGGERRRWKIFLCADCTDIICFTYGKTTKVYHENGINTYEKEFKLLK